MSHYHAFRFQQRQHAIIEQVCHCDQRLCRLQLARSHLAVGIDKGLLIDPTDALDRADGVGILRAKETRVRRLDLAMGLIQRLLMLQSDDLGFGRPHLPFG